jgi:hypothetical protein
MNAEVGLLEGHLNIRWKDEIVFMLDVEKARVWRDQFIICGIPQLLHVNLFKKKNWTSFPSHS